MANVPNIEKAARGDIEQLEDLKMRPGGPLTPASLTDTRGGRPPGNTPKVPAGAVFERPPADPRALSAMQRWMLREVDRDYWAQVLAASPPDPDLALFAEMAGITAKAAARNARNTTAWAPE